MRTLIVSEFLTNIRLIQAGHFKGNKSKISSEYFKVMTSFWFPDLIKEASKICIMLFKIPLLCSRSRRILGANIHFNIPPDRIIRNCVAEVFFFKFSTVLNSPCNNMGKISSTVPCHQTCIVFTREPLNISLIQGEYFLVKLLALVFYIRKYNTVHNGSSSIVKKSY